MPSFTPVSATKLYIQIYNQLHAAIVSGRYAVGDKLPSEKDLCAIFNVSRVPVREALCALELNGLIDSMQGAGYYVKDVKGTATDSTEGVEPQEIIRARLVLEPDIAREAALHIDEAGRTELAGIIERLRAEADGDVYTTATDREFHLFLARVSGSALYVKIMELIFRAMEHKLWALILSRTVSTRKYREQNYSEHIQIAQAVYDGRPDDAHARMREHMGKLYERYWS